MFLVRKNIKLFFLCHHPHQIFRTNKNQKKYEILKQNPISNSNILKN